MNLFRIMLILLIAAKGSTIWADEAAAPTLFDPARHMRIEEVAIGMKGYGLSVFKGTAIERFEVEVISIIRNFNPKHDVILITCRGANLEHTGSIAGMSGSPIYLMDNQGRERMAGAFAYGWPLTKDPIAGVQPIEYMLALPETEQLGEDRGIDGALQGNPGEVQGSRGEANWPIHAEILLPGMTEPPPRYPLAGWNTLSPHPRLGGGSDDPTRLRPLGTPLMVAGLSPKLLEQFGPLFRAYGLIPLQAGGGSTTGEQRAGLKPAPTAGGSGGDNDEPAAKLEPGSVLAVPLITGDVEMTAVGTCTEVIGNRVFGFGHPFNGEGPVSLPMGSGQINTVIANLLTSFKIGSLTQVRGTLTSDQSVGVAGTTGKMPPMVPIQLRILYTDGSQDQTYHFNSARHSRFTPLLSALALMAAIGGERELPPYNTLDYDLSLQFANGESMQITNTSVNVGAAELFWQISTPMIAAAENPFEEVMLKQITGVVRVTPEAREANILSVNLPRTKYHPGENVKAFVTYRPFRGQEAVLPVDLQLPRDLPNGTYQLIISDWERFMRDEQTAKPFRFTADNIEEVFAVLKEVASFKHKAVYLRLLRQPDGVAIGRTAMPHLPSSRREVFIGAGRSNTTAFVSSTIQTVPADWVMKGEAEFTLTIDKAAKVDVGTTQPSKPDAASPPAPKTVEPKVLK